MPWIYNVLQDFTIDGKALSNANDDNYEDAYRNKGLYIFGESSKRSCPAPPPRPSNNRTNFTRDVYCVVVVNQTK